MSDSNSKIRKIVKNGIADQVYDQLKENIVQRVWEPGDKMPSENQLAEMFGVSRVSVRVAIQRLITLGLVESRVGDGTYIKDFNLNTYMSELAFFNLDTSDQMEILEFRKAVEGGAIRLAIQRATEEDLQLLSDIYDCMSIASRSEDPAEYNKEDFRFHMQLIKMSKNSIFISAMQALGPILFSHMYIMVKDEWEKDKAGETQEEHFFHRRILEAVKERDEEKCMEVYAQLIEEKMRTYREMKKKNERLPKKTKVKVKNRR